MKRIFLIVLDSVGIGAEPDAPEYGEMCIRDRSWLPSMPVLPRRLRKDYL